MTDISFPFIDLVCVPVRDIELTPTIISYIQEVNFFTSAVTNIVLANQTAEVAEVNVGIRRSFNTPSGDNVAPSADQEESIYYNFFPRIVLQGYETVDILKGFSPIILGEQDVLFASSRDKSQVFNSFVSQRFYKTKVA